MNLIPLDEEEMYQLIGQTHNAPDCKSAVDEGLFQAEIREVYGKLVQCLSPYGEEGDYYGVSDFAVRPDLRDRPTVMAPPAPRTREFAITILNERFFRSEYLEALHRFLTTEGMRYRVWIDQDFDSSWLLRIMLTAEVARIYCNRNEELARLKALTPRNLPPRVPPGPGR